MDIRPTTDAIERAINFMIRLNGQLGLDRSGNLDYTADWFESQVAAMTCHDINQLREDLQQLASLVIIADEFITGSHVLRHLDEAQRKQAAHQN